MKKSNTIIAAIFIFPTIAFSQTLTEKQKVDDFKYLSKILDENFPYFGVAERLTGINWLKNQAQYIEWIKDTKTDKEYYHVIEKVLKDIDCGHTSLYISLFRDHYLNGYREVQRKHSSYRPWVEELEKGSSYWTELFKPDQEKQSGKDTQSGNDYDSTLLSLKILDPNNIAVLTIRSFSWNRIRKDSSRLQKYFSIIKNYNNLIIDIQGNYGGGVTLWNQHIVPRFIKDTVYSKYYLAQKKGDFVNYFYKDKGFKKEDFNTVRKKSCLPKEITEEAYEIYSTSDTIVPKKNIGFSGKIFLLVNNQVYSAAEAFAIFCKTTKWATIAGEVTGGDGIGTDPLLLCLPNSKLIVVFAGQMGLNPDGSSNEEMNTVPDIEIKGKNFKERLVNLVKYINPDIKIEDSDIINK